MSCHDIGRGMNSVVKVILEMYDNGDLDLPKSKKLIRACERGVHWCDGNEYEAIACMRETRCNKCLRPFEEGEEVADLFNDAVYDAAYDACRRDEDFETKYGIVGYNLCHSCSEETNAAMKESLAAKDD